MKSQRGFAKGYIVLVVAILIFILAMGYYAKNNPRPATRQVDRESETQSNTDRTTQKRQSSRIDYSNQTIPAWALPDGNQDYYQQNGRSSSNPDSSWDQSVEQFQELNISNVSIVPSADSARVSWYTNVASKSGVNIGGIDIQSINGMSTYHTVEIRNLAKNTSYSGTINAFSDRVWSSQEFSFRTSDIRALALSTSKQSLSSNNEPFAVTITGTPNDFVTLSFINPDPSRSTTHQIKLGASGSFVYNATGPSNATATNIPCTRYIVSGTTSECVWDFVVKVKYTNTSETASKTLTIYTGRKTIQSSGEDTTGGGTDGSSQ